jgi:hypothetical protein
MDGRICMDLDWVYSRCDNASPTSPCGIASGSLAHKTGLRLDQIDFLSVLRGVPDLHVDDP